MTDQPIDPRPLADLPETRWADRAGRRSVDPCVPDTGTIFTIHMDIMLLVDGEGTRDERLEAVARLLPYVSRGADVATLLGMPS